MQGLNWPGSGTITWKPEDVSEGPFTMHQFAKPALERTGKRMQLPVPGGESHDELSEWLRKYIAELEAIVAAPDRPVTADDLEWAATSRCRCGAGYCYPKFIHDPLGNWFCSACILGTAAANSEHDAAKPFAFWNIKSDLQPSANGATTRPKCRGCDKALQPPESGLADCCPCNSGRGVNHGLVPRDCCTCAECDPAQTGSSRRRTQ